MCECTRTHADLQPICESQCVNPVYTQWRRSLSWLAGPFSMRPLSSAATISQKPCLETAAKPRWMNLALEKYQRDYAQYQKDRTQLLDWVAKHDREKNQAFYDFQNTDQALALYNQTHRAKVALPQEPKFSDYYKPSPQQKNGELLFIGASTLVLGYAAFRFLKTIRIHTWRPNSRRSTTAPGGYWKGLAAIKQLAAAAKISEDVAKQWLTKQALWQIYLPGPRYIPRPKFDVSLPNAVHQADLLFLPHDKLPRGKKVYKYALTVVDVASRYKAAEALTSKESDEVSRCFAKIYRRGPLKRP